MRSLKSTTAAVLAVSLALPVPAVAQGQGQAKGHAKQLARDLELEMCAEATSFPCVTEQATLLIDQPDLAETLEACTGEGDALPCLTADDLVEVEAESDLAMDALAADEDVAEPTAEAETVTSESQSEDSASTTEEGTTAEAQEQPTNEESAAVAESETPAEETAAPEETAEATEEPPAEPMAEETATDETTAAAEATEEAPADQTVAEAPSEAEETVITEEAPAAAAAAASAEAEETAEVETEEVTEDTARSSSEDFQTAVTGDATANTTVASDDDGLSNFEKALLIGLGAVAVGSILDNGDEVVSNSGDRVVLQDDQGNLRVLKNDDALLRQPGAQVQTETFGDGSTRTTVTREDGTKIVTIRDANGRVLRRVREFADGSRVVLFDDTEVAEPVDITALPEVQDTVIEVDTSDEDALRLALAEAQTRDFGRTFSLNQVRQIRQVRELVPELDLDAVTFATGSAAIDPSQAEELTALGRAMSRIIRERPGEVFLIEGHTDAVGSATYNLALSDRRAETVALALTEYFDVPPENMITQGYGESALKIVTLEAERANRRATIRRITPLLRQAVLDN